MSAKSESNRIWRNSHSLAELAGRPKTRQLGLYQLPPSSSTLGQKSSSESSPGSPVLGLKSTQSDDLIYSSSNPLGIFNMGIEKSSSEASGSKATAGAAASFVPAATAPEFRPMSSRGEAPTPAPAGPRAATPLAYRPKGAQAPEMATSGSTGGGQGRYAGRALMPGANFLYQPQLEYETPPVERKAPPGGGGAAAGAKEKPPSHAGPSSQGSSGAANVSHTSSKTWVSEEEQLRMDYNRMRERVQHIGAAGSPCLPRTMFDYAGFEAQIRIVNANKMMKKIRTMRDDLASKEAAQKHGNTTRETRMLAKAFAQPGDGRSVALGMQSSFNAVRAPPPPPEQVDWPSHAELKANGDDRQRAGGFGRYLPPPRKNTIDARMLGEVPGAARVVPATADTPYSFKQVVGDRWDWVSAAEKARLKAEPTEEIHPDEVHDGLRDLLEEINDFADEEDLPGGRRWVK